MYIIKAFQNKTSVKYHYLPIRMAKLQDTDNTPELLVEQQDLLLIAVEIQNSTVALEGSLAISCKSTYT